MKKASLNDINKDIYDVFVKHDIKEHEMLTVYKNCYRDFEMNFISVITIEEKYFNILRDIIWYNFEHKNEKDLSMVGNVFPHFMSLFDEINEIKYDDVDVVANELKDIKKKIGNKNVYVVNLSGKEEAFNNINTKVNFIDKRKEKQFTNDKTSSKEITCYVYDELALKHMDVIKINNLIDTLLDALDRAKKNESKIGVEFI